MSDPTGPAHERPFIPPPPKGKVRKRERNETRRGVWLVALIVGIAAGAACYRLLSPVSVYFDYWLARLFS